MNQTHTPKALPANVLPRLRRRLLDRQRELVKEFEGAETALLALEEEREIETGDAAQQEQLVRVLDGLESRELHELRDVRRALEKMAAGSYGVCEECGGRIPPLRLEALPQARTCYACEEREPRRA